MSEKPRTTSVHQMRELVNQGQRMSNWLYNIKQWASVPTELREEAKMLQESWDEIRRGPSPDDIDRLAKEYAESHLIGEWERRLVGSLLADFAKSIRSGAAQEVSPAISEKCGQPAASFIPRWGMSFACVLPKGHEGQHKQGGKCFKHGEYVGSQCSQWPNCVQEVSPPSPETEHIWDSITRVAESRQGCNTYLLSQSECQKLLGERLLGDTRELKAALQAAIPFLFEHGSHQNNNCYRGSDDGCYCGLDEAKEKIRRAGL